MAATPPSSNVHQFRTWPKDLGVALVFLAAIGLGWLMYQWVDRQTVSFAPEGVPFKMDLPARWAGVDTLQDVLLKAQDPQTDSAYKTTLTIESRELDLASPPTLQTMLDRRVQQVGALPAYHFVSESPQTINGAKAMALDYAFAAQPIDQPRRASLPVVVQAREYIIVGKDRAYYVTLTAPQNEYDRARAKFERAIQTAQVQ
ncbi:MAG: hypothetical protein U0768_19840 [Anaerolineae bacterium]